MLFPLHRILLLVRLSLTTMDAAKLMNILRSLKRLALCGKHVRITAQSLSCRDVSYLVAVALPVGEPTVLIQPFRYSEVALGLHQNLAACITTTQLRRNCVPRTIDLEQAYIPRPHRFTAFALVEPARVFTVTVRHTGAVVPAHRACFALGFSPHDSVHCAPIFTLKRLLYLLGVFRA